MEVRQPVFLSDLKDCDAGFLYRNCLLPYRFESPLNLCKHPAFKPLNFKKINTKERMDLITLLSQFYSDQNHPPAQKNSSSSVFQSPLTSKPEKTNNSSYMSSGTGFFFVSSVRMDIHTIHSLHKIRYTTQLMDIYTFHSLHNIRYTTQLMDIYTLHSLHNIRYTTQLMNSHFHIELTQSFLKNF